MEEDKFEKYYKLKDENALLKQQLMTAKEEAVREILELAFKNWDDHQFWCAAHGESELEDLIKLWKESRK